MNHVYIAPATAGRVTVEVFKTNVATKSQAGQVLNRLLCYLPWHGINFDLEDCDRILRVEGENIDPDVIIALVRDHGFLCEVLED